MCFGNLTENRGGGTTQDDGSVSTPGAVQAPAPAPEAPAPVADPNDPGASGQSPYTTPTIAAADAKPAPAAAAPLPAPEEPEIGKRRRAEMRRQFGVNRAVYRARSDNSAIGPDGQIRM